MRKATKKDLTSVREKTTRFADAIHNKITTADLKDLGGHATVRMRWDLNESSKRDRVFELEVNGQRAYLDLEELMNYTRLI